MKWLLRNFWLKLVAFVMALLIWVHVATEKTYNYELQMPISEITLKEGLTLAEAPPDSIVVAVSARGKQLLRQQWRSRGVRINANQFQAGRFNLTVSANNTSLSQPTGEVSLDEVISPTMIQLWIDAEDSIQTMITADIDAAADDGFAIGHELEIEPAEVTLIGPRSELNKARVVRTRHKRLESLRNTVTIKLPLVPPPGYGFRVQPDSVAVTIPVLPVKTRVFEKVAVAVLNVPPDQLYRVEPSTVKVELTGYLSA